MADELEVDSVLSKEAQRRKERLAELRAKHSKVTAGPKSEGGSTNSQALPKPVFRSYKPIDDNLKTATVSGPELLRPEDEIKDQLSASKHETVTKDIDVSTLAPRKPDWDLKRDIAPLLEKLERRTQKAIAEIIRERLQSEKSSVGRNWAEAVMASGKT